MGTDVHPYVEVRVNGQWQKAAVKVPRDRNYQAFAKLADVRNGRGFAGCDTGDAQIPISEPRGLPADTTIRDTSEDVPYESPDYVWLGDHSHSWLTLRELLAVDYNAPVTLRGYVSPEAAKRFREGGGKYPPREYCGWTSDTSWEQIEWQLPLYEAAPLLPKILASICSLGEPDDVRLVFGFDS